MKLFSSAPRHTWKFFRSGGLEQVALETADDVLALDQLDQKLWVALSCPVKGLEIDEKTLALIDADGDGRIAVPDVIAATKWAAARLKDPAAILAGAERLPLAAIVDSTAEGSILIASAQQMLASLGHKGGNSISVEEAADTGKIFAGTPLNGDGIIPSDATDDAVVQAVIKDIIASGAGSTRKTGVVGVTATKIDAFFSDLVAYLAWTAQGAGQDVQIFGDGTDAAFSALKAVRAKVDDYFGRMRLAAFDHRAIIALNRSEAEYLAIAAKDMKITAEEARAFPLARVEPGRPLPLLEGVNPAWAAELAAFHAKVVTPVFGAAKTTLTAEEWTELNGRLAPYETWLGSKTGGAVEKLGLARVKEILSSHARTALSALVVRDKTLEPEFNAIRDVERLVRYHRDLRALLHNFVNFADFYSRDRYGAFQNGTLFLDSRSTELCIRVDGPNPLAAASKAYIAYCACTRADGAKMNIAACFTQGDSDYLFVGRNGIFYDRQGRLWYTIITSIVDNPISIRQAFWSPYKKFLRMIEEHIAKRAAAADADANAKLATAAEKTATADKLKPEPKKVDLALITGIGVALGSIGTFIATLFAKFVDVPGWQIPLIFIGLILVISLPAMFIAALKLRHRNLGPILEGNGWAINGRVKINIPFGAALTQSATLPPGAKRSFEDPYEDKEAKRQRRLWIFLIVVIVVGGAAIWIRWDRKNRGRYFWESAPAVEASAAAPAAPAVAPAPAKKS